MTRVVVLQELKQGHAHFHTGRLTWVPEERAT